MADATVEELLRLQREQALALHDQALITQRLQLEMGAHLKEATRESDDFRKLLDKFWEPEHGTFAKLQHLIQRILVLEAEQPRCRERGGRIYDLQHRIDTLEKAAGKRDEGRRFLKREVLAAIFVGVAIAVVSGLIVARVVS